ncbi:MAG: NifB/NifX family molybdenum-iron cluster-binding protein [Candidatus Lokiarchaeota archaeon]|nr:NifB/NifX family molybdenum-iron cluster-binding protein [Candidatus Harpocratesius repetitus]
MSETKTIKIAVPSTSDQGLKAKATTRFGRCPIFTIVSLNDGEIETVSIIENKASQAMGGAGPLAVQSIANEGVNTIIGGYYGPNAANALKQANIQMFGPLKKENATVAELIDAFLKNELEEINSATSPGHRY